MSNYDITVIYACHDNETYNATCKLQQVGVDESQIEIIKVLEDDPFAPRKKSLEKISEASGKYTIMLDDTDDFSEYFLSEMLKAAGDKKKAFVMPAYIGKHIQRKTEYFKLNNVNKSIYINTQFSQSTFPTDLQGILVNTVQLKHLYHLYQNEIEVEKRIIVSLLKENNRFMYLGTEVLEYGIPKECDYQYDVRCLKHEWYWQPLELFLLPLLEEVLNTKGIVDRFLQCMALHMMHIRFYANENNRNKHVLSVEEVGRYKELCQKIFQYIDYDVIMSSESNLTSSSLKYKILDIRLKKNNFTWYPSIQCTAEKVYFLCEGKRLTDIKSLPVRIFLIDYVDGCLEIDGEVDDLFSTELCELYVKIGEHKCSVMYNQRYSLTKCFGVTFAKMKTFHVSVPVYDFTNELLMNFYINIGGMEYRLEYAFPGHTSRFTKFSSYGYWCFDKYLSYWNSKGIHITKKTALKVIKKEVRFWQALYKAENKDARNNMKLRMVNYILHPYFNNKKIWMFMDKIYKGGDSSEYLYKYACEQNDGIEKYYLLDRNSADYHRLIKEGYKPLIRGSLKHRLIFLNADTVIASNSTVYAFNDYNEKTSQYVRGCANFDVACVQHGMSVQKIAIAQQRLRDNTKMYFCASKYEMQNLSHPVYDYVGYDALHLTGVPRYDGLKDRAEKILLFAPTWRMQSAMSVTKNEGVARDYNPHFKETSYYKIYNSLINDERLLNAAQQYGYRIKYVLHPIVSPQYDDFEKNDFVEIISAIGEMSYEDLFCESSLMVTDFSGVQFDFAYMRKPVVYLHHDDIPKHYEEGIFTYENMGFGEICHNNDTLIDTLIKYMETGCEMPEIYKRRADDFFEYSDHKNCERIYQVMIERIKR